MKRSQGSLFTILAMAALVATVDAANGADTKPDAKADAARIAEVMKLLHDSPLIDGHNDIPWEFRKFSNNIDQINFAADTSKGKPKLVTDIPRLRAGGVGGQFWSVYIPTSFTNGEGVKAVLEQIDIAHRLIKGYPKDLELALTAGDIERIHRQGKIASLIGMEGGHSIGNSLAALRMTYALGARYMTLTHTKNVDWADAATDTPQHHGLTAFGEEVVHEMNRIGMLVDLSHVSDETMRHVLRVTKAPVIFSHSSARGVCNHPRNVPDDILKLVAQNGGVVMVNFVPGYLTETTRKYWDIMDVEESRLKKLYPNDEAKVDAGVEEWKKTNHPKHVTLSDVADHIDHIRKVVGADYIGIGADYEGFSHPPDGLEDVSKYPNLLAELLRRGYSKDEIKKIAGQNVLRVMHQAEKVSAAMQKTVQK
ncbi:MAG: rane dipeptidase [Verrucomicrobiales bacterium]|nr:rane dipeptidase [Verrucomicrobiales bacterium]